MNETSEMIWGIAVTSIILIILCVFIVSFIVVFLKRKNRYLREVEELMHTYQQELLKSQLEIQEQTLKQISEEIHDNIGQVLSLAKLHLNVLPAPPASENVPVISKIKDLISKAINDLRQLSKSLHPDRINELGLEENVKQELEMLEKTGLYATTFNIAGARYKLPTQQETFLFRIVQEGMNNIIKHAAASKVDVSMLYNEKAFTLTLTDNGKGFLENTTSPFTAGIGLRNMRNRATLIGAQITFLPASTGGTVLKLILPVAANNID